MNTNDFIQYPESGKTYARNEVPPFVVSMQGSVLAELYVGGTKVFSGSYTSDFDGMVTVDFSDIYGNYLETRMPAVGDVEINQTGYRRLFTAIFRVLIGEETSEEPPVFAWYVANADLRPEGGFDTWCRTAFLTGQPAEKPIYHDTPEWLSWLDLDGGSCLKVRFYRKKNGQPFNDVVVSPSFSAPTCRSVSVGYKRLSRLAIMANPSNLMPYYDLVLFDAKGNELTRQRYLYVNKTGLEKYYCFVNGLGGIDTLVCRGENTLQPKVSHNIGRFNRTGNSGGTFVAMDDTDDQLKWSQETGAVPCLWRDWISDLFAAKRGAAVYDATTTAYHEIVVASSEVEMGDKGQVASASFSYIMSEAGSVITSAGQKSPDDMRQSAVDIADDLIDETIEMDIPLDEGVSEAVTIPSERLMVLFEGLVNGTVVTCFIDGVAAGTLTVGANADPFILTIPYGSNVSFGVDGSADAMVKLNYYEGRCAEEFYRAAWEEPVCVQREPAYFRTWSAAVCVQVEIPYSFGWSESVCVAVVGSQPYSYGWSESVCVLEHLHELTWHDLIEQ